MESKTIKKTKRYHPFLVAIFPVLIIYSQNIGRVEIEQLFLPIIEANPSVRYLAVSNVENKNDLQPFLEKLPDYINIVPKIESTKAVENIKEICDSLKTEKKIVMLDHDDLFSSLIRNNKDRNSFQEYIKKLIDFCEENDISLLRTVGVVFSDDEKRITQYEK